MLNKINFVVLSGTLINDFAPYSGIVFHELKLLLPYLKINRNGKMNPPAKALAGRTLWQYGSGNHISEKRRILGSLIITAILDRGTNIEITHVVIGESSE